MKKKIFLAAIEYVEAVKANDSFHNTEELKARNGATAKAQRNLMNLVGEYSGTNS